MDKFAAALKIVMGMYNRKLSEAEAAMWLRAIVAAGITSDQACAALESHLTDPDVGQYAPKPADLIAKVRGNGQDVEARAYAAFGEALETVRKVGAYRAPTFEDGAIGAAIQSLGGWTSFCQADTEPGVLRSQFVKAYVGATRMGKSVKSLPGIHEPATLPVPAHGLRLIGGEA